MKKTYQLYAPWITALLIALTPFLLSSDIFHNKKEEKEEIMNTVVFQFLTALNSAEQKLT